MIKVLTIGGATQDIFLHYDSADTMNMIKKGVMQNYMLFQPGEKLEIDTLSYLTGGGATNAATSFKRLGFETSCFCNIGNDQAGNFVTQSLEHEKIDHSLVYQSSHHQTGVSCIINTTHGEQTIFAFRGANSHLELDKLPFDQIKQSNQLYITSLSNNSARLLPDIVSFAKQHKVPVAINPGTSQLATGALSLKESLKYIDILILNSSEAKTFMTALIEFDANYRITLQSKAVQDPCTLNAPNDQPYLMEFPLACEDHYFSIPNFFKAVLDMGPSIVVVTNGANGVYAATGNNFYFHPSLKVNVVDSVGAGDSFGSCFVASLLLKKSIEDALRNGIINSASVLEHLGAKAGLLTYQQLTEKAQKLHPNLLQTFRR